MLKEATFTSDLDAKEVAGKKIIRRKNVLLPKFPNKNATQNDGTQSSNPNRAQLASLDDSFDSSASEAELNEDEILSKQNVQQINLEIVHAPETTEVSTQTSLSLPSLGESTFILFLTK